MLAARSSTRGAKFRNVSGGNDNSDGHRCVEVRKQVSVTRRFPFQAWAETLGMDFQNDQVRLSREVLLQSPGQLFAGRKVNESVPEIVCGAVPGGLNANLFPNRSR